MSLGPGKQGRAVGCPLRRACNAEDFVSFMLLGV